MQLRYEYTKKQQFQKVSTCKVEICNEKKVAKQHSQKEGNNTPQAITKFELPKE